MQLGCSTNWATWAWHLTTGDTRHANLEHLGSLWPWLVQSNELKFKSNVNSEILVHLVEVKRIRGYPQGFKFGIHRWHLVDGSFDFSLGPLSNKAPSTSHHRYPLPTSLVWAPPTPNYMSSTPHRSPSPHQLRPGKDVAINCLCYRLLKSLFLLWQDGCNLFKQWFTNRR